MIMDALFRRSKTISLALAAAILPMASVNAGGWWNHRSVVAVPTGGPVGTVTGAAPYQIFTAPAAAPAVHMPVAQSPAYSYSYAAPTYAAPSYAAPAAAPAYGFWVPMQASAPQGGAYGAAAPQGGNNDDLVRELASRLKAASPAAAAATPTAQSAAGAPAANLSTDELLRELGRRQQAAAAPAYGAAPAYAPAYAVPAQPVLLGYSYAAPAAAPQYAQPAQAGTMSLVPVQLYKQKNILGHEKLKSVSVYPYGVR